MVNLDWYYIYSCVLTFDLVVWFLTLYHAIWSFFFFLKRKELLENIMGKRRKCWQPVVSALSTNSSTLSDEIRLIFTSLSLYQDFRLVQIAGNQHFLLFLIFLSALLQINYSYLSHTKFVICKMLTEPFPKPALVFTCLQNGSFENTAGKEEITRNEHFSFSHSVFYPF